MGPRKHVMITVTNNRTEVDIHTVTISKKQQEEVCWHCPQGEAVVVFENGSPFESAEFRVPKNGSVSSGSVTGPCAKGYKYTVTVLLRGRELAPPLDPDVDVEP